MKRQTSPILVSVVALVVLACGGPAIDAVDEDTVVTLLCDAMG